MAEMNQKDANEYEENMDCSTEIPRDIQQLISGLVDRKDSKLQKG